MVSPAAFGMIVRTARLKQELTISKLAEISGVSQPYLSQIENGRGGVPSPDILKKLEKALDVKYSSLMRFAGYLPEISVNEMMPDQEERMNKFDESIRFFINLFGSAIVNHTPFSDAAEKGLVRLITDSFEKAGKSLNYRHQDLPEPDFDIYADFIIDTHDNEFIWEILEKLKDLAQQLRIWNPPNNDSILIKDTSKDLSSFLRQEDITYGSEPLTEKDRNEILAIIEWHLRGRILPS